MRWIDLKNFRRSYPDRGIQWIDIGKFNSIYDAHLRTQLGVSLSKDPHSLSEFYYKNIKTLIDLLILIDNLLSPVRVEETGSVQSLRTFLQDQKEILPSYELPSGSDDYKIFRGLTSFQKILIIELERIYQTLAKDPNRPHFKRPYYEALTNEERIELYREFEGEFGYHFWHSLSSIER